MLGSDEAPTINGEILSIGKKRHDMGQLLDRQTTKVR